VKTHAIASGISSLAMSSFDEPVGQSEVSFIGQDHCDWLIGFAGLSRTYGMKALSG